MTDRKAKQRRLERAGYVYVAGWLPVSSRNLPYADTDAETIRDLMGVYALDVARIGQEPPKPRGRPKREA